MATETSTSEVLQADAVSSRGADAYLMLMNGVPRSEIAELLGFDSITEVGRAITDELKRQSQFLEGDARTALFQIEMDRLDSLWRTFYPIAMQGSVKDAELCLHITDRRIKLGQLDALDSATQGQTVLVIGGNEGSYIAKLKELAE
jgi:hypothetical protein